MNGTDYLVGLILGFLIGVATFVLHPLIDNSKNAWCVVVWVIYIAAIFITAEAVLGSKK